MDIQKYYQYCCGEGYLDKRRYNEDAAFERGQNRVSRDVAETLYTSSQRLANYRYGGASENPFAANTLPGYQNFTGFQRVLGGLLQPLLNTALLLQALSRSTTLPLPNAFAGLLNRSGQQMEAVVGQVLSFFFGHKKDKTDEKEKRELNDLGIPDIFGNRVVEESAEAQMGRGDQ